MYSSGETQEETPQKETQRFVYDHRRSFFPRRLKCGAWAWGGKKYYHVEVVSYHPDSSNCHRYVRTDRISEEGFCFLKLKESFVISEKDLDEAFRS